MISYGKVPKQINLIFPMLLVGIVLQGCCPHNRLCQDDVVIPNLYQYNNKVLIDYLTTHGYRDRPVERIARNSTGTRLYLHVGGAGKVKEVLVVGARGIERSIVKPGDVSFLDDSGEVVAWTNDYKKGVQFRNGYARRFPYSDTFDVDSSGTFYFVGSSKSGTAIFKSEDPQTLLSTSNFKAREIFFVADKVYLFGSNERDFRSPGDYKVFEIIGHVFRYGKQKLEFEQTIRIDRPSPHSVSPFAVLDVDPFSGRILILDVWDFPSKSQWFIYDLEKRSLKKAGSQNGDAFFLKEDLLKSSGN